MANEFKVKKGLIVDGTNTVLDIQGTQGQLFSVTDSLTGDLFSVSDISGVPILNVNSSGLVDIDGDLNLGDSNKIQLGDSQDLQMYHDGSNSYIKDAGVGDLIIDSGTLKLRNANGSKTFIEANSTAVELYHNNVEKLATTSAGVSITGSMVSSSVSTSAISVTGNSTVTGISYVNTYLVTPIIYSGGGSVSFGNDIQLGSNILKFDQSGTRSWNIKAADGKLKIYSGDGLGNYDFDHNIVTTGGLQISGSIDPGATDYGYYQSAGNNIILKGDSSGRSGIFFESEKDGTNINDPSDYGFIQFHSYGYGNTSGEANNLVIGVSNDSTDHVILQSPYNGGVKVGYLDATSGTGLTTQTVFHDAYHPNADVWTTARTITLGGDLTGSVSINGSADVTLTAAVVDDSHNHDASNINSGTLAAARLPAQLSSVASTSDALGIYFRGATEVVSGEGWCTAHYAYNYNDGFLFLNRDAQNVATPVFHIGGYNNAGHGGWSSEDSIITLTRLDGTKSTGSTYSHTGLSNTTYYTNIVKTTTKTEFKDAQGLHHFNSNVTLGGTLTASADVIAYSDAKLKENVKTLDGSKVLQMRGVSFDRKDNGASSSGVIAQEMQKVAPELVSDDDGTLGVAYGNITGYLIEAIKNQQKQINKLTKIIENGNNV
jgi:hypothetical protein